jgi:hypothetical protein
MTTFILSEDDLVERFNFLAELIGYRVERDDSLPSEGCSYTDFTLYHDGEDYALAHIGFELEYFARAVKILKPWERLAKRETAVITDIETSSLA